MLTRSTLFAGWLDFPIVKEEDAAGGSLDFYLMRRRRNLNPPAIGRRSSGEVKVSSGTVVMRTCRLN